MKKVIIIQLVFVLLLVNGLVAQNNLSETNVKNALTKIFDLSKNQDYESLASLILYNKRNELRSYNNSNKSEAKSVKRMSKKIKAYLDLSDSYEYESLTNGKENNLPSVTLKVNFKSGDQELTISFFFVDLNGNLLLSKFK